MLESEGESQDGSETEKNAADQRSLEQDPAKALEAEMKQDKK
jgi:hypothetical protein